MMFNCIIRKNINVTHLNNIKCKKLGDGVKIEEMEANCYISILIF